LVLYHLFEEFVSDIKWDELFEADTKSSS